MTTLSSRTKKIKVRNIFIVVLVLLIFTLIFYKFFEWKTISNIAEMYNTSYFNEIKLVSQNDASEKNLSDNQFNQKLDKTKNTTELLSMLDSLNSYITTLINENEGYVDLISKDQKRFEKLKTKSNMLFGEKGSTAKEIVNNQIYYYNDELKYENSNLAAAKGALILFTIYRDNAGLNEFVNKIGSSTDSIFISKYFDQIASLEKYTNSEFKFNDEDFVNTYYPDFISKINNWKKFFSAYYLAEKDFTAGNIDAGVLELQAVRELGASSYIDYSSLFSEQKAVNLDLEKNILTLVSDQAAAIKNYKNKQFYKYPLLKNPDTWQEDFVLCQMYSYKTEIYREITSKYPVAKNVSDLVKELSSISPKTDNVDNSFDQSVMTFSNTDKELQFSCTDEINKEKLEFTIAK